MTGKLSQVRQMMSGEMGVDQLRALVNQMIDIQEDNVTNEAATQVVLQEHQIGGGIDHLVRSIGVGEFTLPQTPEDRKDELLEAADSILTKDFEEWWWETRAPRMMENAETAHEFVGLSKRAWANSIENWANLYRTGDNPDWVEHMTDAQLAHQYAKDTFGLTLKEFAAIVVEWEWGPHVRQLLFENFNQETVALHEIASWLESDRVEITVHEEPDWGDPEPADVEVE